MFLQDREKRTPLHAAAYRGHGNVVDLLLVNGARVNCKDNQWLTPLHRACRSDVEVPSFVSSLLEFDFTMYFATVSRFPIASA